MQVSGIGASYSPYLSKAGAQSKSPAAEFGNLLDIAAKTQADASSRNPGAVPPTATQARKVDFSKMTPAEFGSEGSAMYKRGEIDFDTMTAMVLRSDSIARMDAEAGRAQSYDFKEVFKGYMAFIEKSGSKNDPTSGYHILERVMSKIA